MTDALPVDPVAVARKFYRETLLGLGYAPHKVDDILAGDASTSGVHMDIVMWVERGARATLSAVQAQKPAVRVKALEWHERGPYEYADTPIGEYVVYSDNSWSSPGSCHEPEPTKQQAKEKCQAHLDRIILSALEEAPPQPAPRAADLYDDGHMISRIEQPAPVLHSDGIHDDTAAIQAIQDGNLKVSKKRIDEIAYIQMTNLKLFKGFDVLEVIADYDREIAALRKLVTSSEQERYRSCGELLERATAPSPPARRARAVIDPDPFDFYDQIECWQCGGDGFVAACFEEYACIDPEGGCDYCMRRCDICKGKGGWPRIEPSDGASDE